MSCWAVEKSVGSKFGIVFLVEDRIHVKMIPMQNMASFNEVYGSVFMLKVSFICSI